MRVLALTSESDRHLAFAARVLDAFDDVVIGIEPKSNSPVRRRTLWRTARALAPRIKGRIINRAYSTIYRGMAARYWADKNEIERRFFGETATQRTADVDANLLFRVANSERINERQYVEKIRDHNPDVILVMGTSLLSNRIIKLSNLASLNMHTGLSPYYRGSNTNFWPLVENRPEYCGVTVHALTTGIDSGGIVKQARPQIVSDDTFFSINCKSIELGIAAIINSVHRLSQDSLEYVPQWESGNLYLGRDMNSRKISRYYKLIESGMIETYLQRLDRGEVSIPRTVE